MRQMDECPVRGCGYPILGVGEEEFDGAQFDCEGPRRHRLTLEVFDGGEWRWRNDGPTPSKIIELQDRARAARYRRSAPPPDLKAVPPGTPVDRWRQNSDQTAACIDFPHGTTSTPVDGPPSTREGGA